MARWFFIGNEQRSIALVGTRVSKNNRPVVEGAYAFNSNWQGARPPPPLFSSSAAVRPCEYRGVACAFRSARRDSVQSIGHSVSHVCAPSPSLSLAPFRLRPHNVENTRLCLVSSRYLTSQTRDQGRSYVFVVPCCSKRERDGKVIKLWWDFCSWNFLEFSM